MSSAPHDQFKRWEGDHAPTLRCPVCGSRTAVWQFSETPADQLQRVVMCDSGEADFEGTACSLLGCPLAMPPMALYCATAKRAVEVWNAFVLRCYELRTRHAGIAGDAA